MRSAAQIGRTVGEYHDWQRSERQKHLKQLLAILRRARESEAEWYTWITSGRPRYTQAQYDAIQKASKRGP